MPSFQSFDWETALYVQASAKKCRDRSLAVFELPVSPQGELFHNVTGRKLLKRPLALSLILCLGSIMPLQLSYADTLLPVKTESVQTTPTNTSLVPSAIQAQVIAKTPAMTEESAQSLIQITLSPTPLASKLQKSYEAYRVTVQSDYPGILKLQSASVNNAQSGTMAYELVKSGMTPVYCTLLLGLAGFVLIGVPMLIVKNGHNDKTRRESLAYTNQIPLVELNKGETFNFNTLVPLGQKPDVSLSFRDRQNGLLFSKRSL
jgi:hypothetical protein